MITAADEKNISPTDLKIYQKAEALYIKCRPIIIGFPHVEKFGLSLDLKNSFYSLLQSIVLANRIKHKRKMYQNEADGFLSLIIVQFSIARRDGYITEKRNLEIQVDASEIGAMLGGWMKVTK